MKDNFDMYSVDVDTDCICTDFDDYDLYGERMEECGDTFGNDLEFE